MQLSKHNGNNAGVMNTVLLYWPYIHYKNWAHLF